MVHEQQLIQKITLFCHYSQAPPLLFGSTALIAEIANQEQPGFSQSQPQPTQPQSTHLLESHIWNAFMYVLPV